MEKLISRRFVLHVGYSCNEACQFCYYRDSIINKTAKDHSTTHIMKKLRKARSYGKVEVEFSGGEPTIRKDLAELIKYACDVGFEKVSVITNGLMMSRKEYCEKLLNAGLNDCLFSLHGPDAEVHDRLTCVRGSFDKIITAMCNMKELKASFRANMVVNNLNINRLDDQFTLLKELCPVEVNLLVYNPAEEMYKYDQKEAKIEDYSIIGEKINDAINKYQHFFSVINVRFLPFCLLKGNEKNIRTMFQKIYEKNEWDPFLFMKFHKSNAHALISIITGIPLALMKLPRYGKRKLYTLFGEVVQLSRITYNNKQLAPCKKCALRKICPGLHRSYIKSYDKTIVKPYDGLVIQDPLHFINGHENKFENRTEPIKTYD